MMEDLEKYLNKLINLSPLVSNLFYMRDFLLNKGAKEGLQNQNENLGEAQQD